MKWFIFALSSAFTWALVVISSKLAMEKMNPMTVSTFRSIVTTIFLIIMMLMYQKFDHNLYGIEKKYWLYILYAGFIGSISWYCYFIALKHGAASKVAGVERLTLVFVLIFSGLFLGEVITYKMIFGATLMLLGMYFIAF